MSCKGGCVAAEGVACQRAGQMTRRSAARICRDSHATAMSRNSTRDGSERRTLRWRESVASLTQSTSCHRTRMQAGNHRQHLTSACGVPLTTWTALQHGATASLRVPEGAVNLA